MSTFEDEFEIPTASEIDPAAEFLAKEQVILSTDFLLRNLKNISGRTWRYWRGSWSRCTSSGHSNI